MESAIREGRSEAVKRLLANKSPRDRLQILSRKYGGRADSKFPGDGSRVWQYTEHDHLLYGGTSPILHAALKGDVEIFWEIAEAIRTNQLAVDVDRVKRFEYKVWLDGELEPCGCVVFVILYNT